MIEIDREATEIVIETEIAKEIENGNGSETVIAKGNANESVSGTGKRKEIGSEKESGNEKRCGRLKGK